VLLHYGFTMRNLHRIWLDTTASNEAALRSYAAAGFVEEGRLREAAFVNGRYVDAVRMAVLRSDWEAR
jgi:RimJ/RimL family protein N-acetyltransferase